MTWETYRELRQRLQDEAPKDEHGWPMLRCEHCDGLLEEFAAFVAAEAPGTGEPVLVPLHPWCEREWRERCREGLTRPEGAYA